VHTLPTAAAVMYVFMCWVCLSASAGSMAPIGCKTNSAGFHPKPELRLNTDMKPTYATTMGFQREGVALWRTILRKNRKQEWIERQFKKFLDEQIKAANVMAGSDSEPKR
jgi:hypothetical protein